MKKYFQLLFAGLFVVGFILASIYLKNRQILSPYNSDNNSIDQETKEGKVKTAKIEIGEKTITAEVADNDKTRELGLSFRTKLDGSSGMLFVFDSYVTPFFWMKDMQIPLDMIWIRDDMVIDFDENVPIPNPGTELNLLPKYSPREIVNYVLEVNAGFVKENGVKVGDGVIINF